MKPLSMPVVNVPLTLIGRLYLRKENSKKEKIRSEAPSSVTGLAADFKDLTDKEHPEFRYVF